MEMHKRGITETVPKGCHIGITLLFVYCDFRISNISFLKLFFSRFCAIVYTCTYPFIKLTFEQSERNVM